MSPFSSSTLAFPFFYHRSNKTGNYHYGYFNDYFTDPNRKALFIYDNQVLVGFAIIHPYSNIDENPNYVLAEFTVFPMYRMKHIAVKAAEMIFHQYRGCWEVKYNEKNIAAKGLWNKLTAKYNPQKITLSDMETVLSFSTE